MSAVTIATRVPLEIKQKLIEKASSEGMDVATCLRRLVYNYLELKIDLISSKDEDLKCFLDDFKRFQDDFKRFQELLENMAINLGFLCYECHKPFEDRPKELKPRYHYECFYKAFGIRFGKEEK